MDEPVTVTTTRNFICDGIQLRTRLLIPKWLGNFVLWLFFHRVDTSTKIQITGLNSFFAELEDDSIGQDNSEVPEPDPYDSL